MTDYFTEHDVVLENKLGIEDSELLKRAEDEIVLLRLAELGNKPIQGAFDFKHLRAIHRRLFSDIYQMAGEIRKVDIAKDGSAFCYARFIDRIQEEIFDRLKENNFLRNLCKEVFVNRLAELFGDLNALHPFREGNGRAIRVFLAQVAEQAGYYLSLDDVTKDELLTADISAFNGDVELLATIYKRIIEPINNKNGGDK